eukprot:CCRYP_018872-RA/>CCRYP_018872-RA protein AED:0.19 eAED:0.19 QI:0/0.5/0.33/1/1/1/3/15/614
MIPLYSIIAASETELGPKTVEGEEVFAVAHLFASFNDTFVHVTDLSGRETLVRVTGGMKVKADRDESSPYAAMLAAQDVAARCKELGVTALHVKIRGTGGNKSRSPGPGAQSALRALARNGLKIGRIEDVTPIPSDSTRRKSGRRGRRLRPSLMTAHKVEKVTALRRAEEQRVSELSRYSQESRWLSNCAEREAMVDQTREANLMARKVAEEQQRKLLIEKQQKRQRELSMKAMERQMAVEIRRQQTEQEKRERELQRICETSEELKDLERQLKIAYINKERAAQHQEALLLRKLENDREQAIQEKMEYNRQQEIHRQVDKENERRQSLIAQKKVLQQQMTDMEGQQEKLREESLKEKKMIDDIIAKIKREDEMEHEERLRKVEETRAIVAEFQNERRMHMEAVEREQRVQDAEIEAYNKMMRERAIKEEAEKRRIEDEKKRRWQRVADETRNLTQSQEELDVSRALLWEEELEAKRKKEEEDTARKRMETKKDLMRENNAQIAAKKAILEKMEREEKELVDKMLQKFAEDSEVERREEESRRAFKERFKAEAAEQRLERTRLVQIEKEREIKQQNSLREQEEYKQRVIDEARRKLLERHVDQLRGFLPRKCLE